MKPLNIFIVLVAIFFCFRELGTFPSAWLDDGLFMVAAQSLVRGDGYALPMLSTHWNFPFMLAVGPTVIVPPALSMALFGEFVWAARIPAALYTLATVYAVYLFSKERKVKWNAQFAALLLVTLSAFVNNGKPVMGEVPAIFFLFVSILLLSRMHTTRMAVVTGLLMGVTVVTKITFGLVYPALGMALFVACIQKDMSLVKRYVVAGIVSVLPFALWQWLEFSSQPGIINEIGYYVFADDGSGALSLLKENPKHLLRFPFVYFGILFALAGTGFHASRRTLRNGSATFIITLTLLFLLYFLSREGWYRHLLPAHVLLLPFVPIGAWKMLGRRMGTVLLLFFVIAQGWWQLTYRGSTKSPEAANATVAILHIDQRPLVIEPPEVYFRLPEGDDYLFVSQEFFRTFLEFNQPLTQKEHCLPVVRKVGWEERVSYAERLSALAGRYVLIQPKESCNQ